MLVAERTDFASLYVDKNGKNWEDSETIPTVFAVGVVVAAAAVIMERSVGRGEAGTGTVADDLFVLKGLPFSGL